VGEFLVPLLLAKLGKRLLISEEAHEYMHHIVDVHFVSPFDYVLKHPDTLHLLHVGKEIQFVVIPMLLKSVINQ